MPTLLEQKQEELAAKQKRAFEIFEEGGEDVVLTPDQLHEVKSLNDEMNHLGEELDGLREATEIKTRLTRQRDELSKPRRPWGNNFAGGRDDYTVPPPEYKSLGELFTESSAYTDFSFGNSRGPLVEVPAEIKTVLSTTAGFAPQALRTGQVIPLPQQAPMIVEVVPKIQTEQNAVVFMRETVYTNAAAETAEGGAYPEAAIQFAEETHPIRKLAVFLPVTDEQMRDIPGMQDRINTRLELMLNQRLDSQILIGDGTAPNLVGITTVSGVQTQARGTDSNADAVYKALLKLRTIAFVNPDMLLFNPNNWGTIRLSKDSVGNYLFGPPSDPGIVRLWGIPITESTYVPLNTAFAGDFRGYTELVYKQGLEFEVSNSHSDYFTKGQLAVRAQLRCAFVVTRPSALCQITGVN